MLPHSTVMEYGHLGTGKARPAHAMVGRASPRLLRSPSFSTRVAATASNSAVYAAAQDRVELNKDLWQREWGPCYGA
jgi:hypothetical protein